MSDEQNPEIGTWQVGFQSDVVRIRHTHAAGVLNASLEPDEAIRFATEVLAAARGAVGHPLPFSETFEEDVEP